MVKAAEAVRKREGGGGVRAMRDDRIICMPSLVCTRTQGGRRQASVEARSSRGSADNVVRLWVEYLPISIGMLSLPRMHDSAALPARERAGLGNFGGVLLGLVDS